MDSIKQLKKIIKDRGVSLELMAGQIGVSHRTLWRWLVEGKTKPSLLGLKMIQEYLDRQAARPKGVSK